MRRDPTWYFEVGDEEFASAIAWARRLETRDLVTIGPEDVDLGPLEPMVQSIRRELTPGAGRGVAVLHRLPLERLNEAEAERLFWGIGLRLGEPVSQNRATEYLCHVRRDSGAVHQGRGYATDAELKFHSDMAEMSALMSVKVAKSGGDSAVASFVTVHDTIAVEHPELLEELYRPFYHGRWEQHPWERPFSLQPVFARTLTAWGGFYNRHLVGLAEAMDGVPSLTPEQTLALEAVAEVANRPDVSYRFALEQGEILFLHNAMVMHARTSFEDAEEPAQWRHLLRLWLDRPTSEMTVPWAVRYDLRYGNSGLVRRAAVTRS